MKRRVALVILAASLGCISAAARQPDGTLGLIRTPNNGIPAIVAPGGQFDVVVQQRAELRLLAEQDGPPLEIQWADLPGGLARADAPCPPTPRREHTL